MGSDKINAARRHAAWWSENIRRARQPRRELSGGTSSSAAPKPAHIVAILIIPFMPCTGKLPEPVAAGTDIPRLGNIDKARQQGILLDGGKKQAMRCKACARATQNGG